jgi:hypothetical protein
MEMHDTVGPLPIANPQPGTRWFCQYGCVAETDGMNRVFIGDTLLGEFNPRDRDLGSRNVLLVMLAKEPKVHLGHLAAAFRISDEHLRRLRLAAKADGYRAVLTRARGCSERDEIDPAKVRELRALFEEGWNPTDATRRQRRRGRVSRSTISRERRRWQAEKEAARGADVATSPVTPAEVQQLLLENVAMTVGREGEAPPQGSLPANATTIAAQEAPDDAADAIGDATIGTLAKAATAACSDDANGAIAKSPSDMYRDGTTAEEAIFGTRRDAGRRARLRESRPDDLPQPGEPGGRIHRRSATLGDLRSLDVPAGVRPGTAGP